MTIPQDRMSRTRSRGKRNRIKFVKDPAGSGPTVVRSPRITISQTKKKTIPQDRMFKKRTRKKVLKILQDRDQREGKRTSEQNQ